MRRILSLLVFCCGSALVANAQVEPAADFTVLWFSSNQGSATAFAAKIYSKRTTVSVLDFEMQAVRVDANGQQGSAQQRGLVTIQGGGVDTAGSILVDINPGDQLEIRILLTHLQEGWSFGDTLRRSYQLAPKPQTEEPTLAVDPNFLEVDGLVIDETLTKSGQDFYGLFYQFWQPPFGASDYSLLLEESPWRGRQTVIKVSVDDQLVYQQILQTRYDALEEMAEQAVGIASQVLQQRMQAEQSQDGESNETIEQF